MSHRLAAFALTFVLAGCSGVRTSAPGPPAALHGSWSGEAEQWDEGNRSATPDSRWTVRVDIGAGAIGAVAYPSIGCGGTLTYLGPVSGGARFREDITTRPDLCIPTGTVTLTRDGDAVVYAASHEGYASVSEGRLRK